MIWYMLCASQRDAFPLIDRTGCNSCTDAGALTSAERLDINTGVWSLLTAAGPLNAERDGHTMLLING